MAVRKSGKNRKKTTKKPDYTGGLGNKTTSKLENLTAKKQIIRYRDKKGHFVSPEKIKGNKYVRWEIWRYSEATRKIKKLDFGDKWKPKYQKLKRAKTPTEILKLCQKRYERHNIKVRMINGEIFAFTASP